MKNNWTQAIKILKKGGVIVTPTDTLYGIVCDAFNKKSVERIYKIKGRDDGKPFIVLINSYDDLNKFGVKLTSSQDSFIRAYWPSKMSVVLPCRGNKFKYIHRGKEDIAFRMVSPKNRNLFNLIKEVGPLVAPSANPQGDVPAKSVWEAIGYFGDQIDMYMCGHTVKSKPSTIVTFKKDNVVILREGAVKIKSK
jgi:L-threonylcarbamoyladenylate synthase